MAELFDPVPVEEMRGAEQAVREAAAALPENLRTRLESAEELDDEDRAAIIDIARQALDAFLAAPDTRTKEKP
jgi:F-type H+-transporting ATPase subunit alpha